MLIIDTTILVIFLISAVISFVRGFVREVFSLLAWIISIWVAITFTPHGAMLLVSHVETEVLRIGIAFVTLFVSTLFLLTMVNHLLSQFVKKTGLSGTDRMVGLIFGVARGGLVVSILVLLAGMTTFPQEVWWTESMLLSHFEQIAGILKSKLPTEVAANIVYD